MSATSPNRDRVHYDLNEMVRLHGKANNESPSSPLVYKSNLLTPFHHVSFLFDPPTNLKTTPARGARQETPAPVEGSAPLPALLAIIHIMHTAATVKCNFTHQGPGKFDGAIDIYGGRGIHINPEARGGP